MFLFSARFVLLILPSRMACSADCSSSNTRAGPVMTGFFRPVILATAPSGDRLPLRIARWPSAYIGLSIGRITSWSARGCVGHVLQHLGDGLAADGDAVAVQQARVQQDLHHLRDAAGLVQVDREVLAARASGRTAPAPSCACARSRRWSIPRRPRARWPGSAAPRWSSRRWP